MSYFNRNRWWTIAFVLLLMMNLATLATVWLLRDKNTPEARIPGQDVADFLTRELGFDSLQKEKLFALREEHHQQIRDVRDRSRRAKDSLFALLKEPNVADSVAAKAAYASSWYDQQLDLITFHHLQKVRALCTDKQKEKFDNIIYQVLRSMNPMPPPPPQHGGPGERPRPDDERDRRPPPQ